MTPERQRVHEAQQLQRLRQLREDQARRARAQAQAALDEAREAVQRREAEVRRHRGARGELVERVCADAKSLPLLAPYVSARREDLDDLLERAEYALIDDEEARDEAQQTLDDASAAWRASLARRDAAGDLLTRARKEQLQAGERRAEREDPSKPRRAQP
jgi:hypothetical protein